MNLLLKLAALAPAIALGVAGSHIRKDLVQIKNDVIVVVEASTNIDNSAGRIAHLSTSPTGPIIGTRGIVYTLPELIDCQPVKRTHEYLSESYIRVALIPDDGDCPIQAKVAQAQYDGAVGAVVYNSTLSTPDMLAALHTQLNSHRPTIPVMVVDNEYGETLRLEVATLLEEAWTSNSDRFRAIFASIFPEDDNEHLSVWEITLISLVVLLGLGFGASLFFHMSPRRRRALDRRLRGNGLGDSSKRIETLPSCALDRLILRTVTQDDVQYLSACTTPLDVILKPGSRNRSIRSGASTSSGCSGCEKHPSADSDDTGSTLGSDRCACTDTQDGSADPALKGLIATCIVCIDDFVVGSKMRILPCGHNFHIECIDPWLTSKSSLCPLCKHDARSVLTDLERAYSGPRITTDPHGLDHSIYSRPSSEPSSYLAESRSHLPMAGALKHISRFAHHVTAPVRALTAKATRAGRRRASSVTEDVDIESTAMTQLPSGPENLAFEARKPAVYTTIPITYTMNIGEDDMPGMIEHLQPAERPGASKSGFEIPEKARDKQSDAENSGNETASDFDKYISRLSLTDTIPSESDLASYFR
ncbi:hypothetical protein LPJ63_001054 [Coemansia sp. RSA 2711]|nr:hypothetical protein LPJ63_001054 [Coemansia sp. RSA 2711]